jgi:hypothetical protein
MNNEHLPSSADEVHSFYLVLSTIHWHFYSQKKKRNTYTYNESNITERAAGQHAHNAWINLSGSSIYKQCPANIRPGEFSTLPRVGATIWPGSRQAYGHYISGATCCCPYSRLLEGSHRINLWRFGDEEHAWGARVWFIIPIFWGWGDVWVEGKKKTLTKARESGRARVHCTAAWLRHRP